MIGGVIPFARRGRGAVLIALVVAILLAAAGCGGSRTETTSSSGHVTTTGTDGATDLAGIRYPDIGFRGRRNLEEHFQKHGREFGDIDQATYLALAQQLRDRPLDSRTLEARRRDGVVTRFDRRRDAFGAYNPDRTIRTYFRPNDGEAYFLRQADR